MERNDFFDLKCGFPIFDMYDAITGCFQFPDDDLCEIYRILDKENLTLVYRGIVLM